MSKEKIEKMFDEDFAKICDDMDIRSGERLWYLRVDDSEKILKKLIFNKILPEVLKDVLPEYVINSPCDEERYMNDVLYEIEQKAKKLYNIEL